MEHVIPAIGQGELEMTRVTIDDDLRQKLLGLNKALELCDERGNVVARLQPSTPWTDPDNWELLTPEVSEEELERLRNSDEPRYTTQEVLDYLKSLN
jgi:hypothetical protein